MDRQISSIFNIHTGVARCEYGDIVASGDASSGTVFAFQRPIRVSTNTRWAILVMYDGYEDFDLWVSKAGDYLVGTQTVSPGASGKYVGSYYDYNSVYQNTVIPGNVAGGTGSSPLWVPSSTKDLKFNVNVARYGNAVSVAYTNTAAPNTTVTSTQVITTYQYFLPQTPNEYLVGKYTSITQSPPTSLYGLVLGARPSPTVTPTPIVSENFFQSTPIFSNGTISVDATSLYIFGSNGVNFNTLYDATSPSAQYIVFNDQTNGKLNVRNIVSIESNTHIIIDKFPTFTNAAAVFLLPSPVGQMKLIESNESYCKYHTGENGTLLTLTNSNANATVRFTSNSIASVIINSGGTGYSNTDRIVVYTTDTATANTLGYTNSSITVTTNSTGGITSTYVGNTGHLCFSNAAYVILNASNATSTGTGANLSFTAGPYVIGELSGYTMADVDIINQTFYKVIPGVTTYTTQYIYAVVAPTIIVAAHAQGSGQGFTQVIVGSKQVANTTPPTTVGMTAMSRSYQALTTGGTTITSYVNTSITTPGNGCIVSEIWSYSNSDFQAPTNPSITFYGINYLINDDYTNENTRYGNCISKHISTKITFDDSMTAEDIVLYLDEYKPLRN